jgi:predicted transcriptional regulator
MDSKVSVTLRVDADLLEAFMDELNLQNESPSQAVEGFMREYIADRQHARDYDKYIRDKVAAAFEDIRAGRVLSNEEVEAHFAARLAELKRKM